MSKGCRRALISQRPAEASEMYRAAGLFHLRRAGRVASPQRVHDMSSETLPKSFAVQGYPVNSGPTRSKIPGANHDFSGKVRSPQRMTWFSYRSGAEYPIRSADCLVLPGMLQPPSDVISRGTAFPCASAPISFSPMRCHQQRDTFPLRIGTHPLLPDGVVRPNASILGGGVLQRFTIRYQSSRHSR
ncbi:hypothetical protein BN1723_002564 [Verticillium longisporum]|uniref:Uncharacterized protein n=1 Tax=Verticillium longisporum TaxID=100787 RepID=A0A0G4LBP8_VERLO|nr:hypothetical protein BN1723_002564 [Verticillium longisporum]